MLLVALDSVVSWPSDRVLLSHEILSRIAGSVLGVCWPWMIVSFVMVFGFRRRPRGEPVRAWYAMQRSQWPRLQRKALVSLGLAAAVCVAVIVTGFTLGVDKGSGRILPGPRYEISASSFHDSVWTPVSAAVYQYWEAQFIREDALFTLFGLALAASSLYLLRLRSVAQRAG